MKVIAFFSLILCLGQTPGDISWLAESGQKKIEKTLAKLWKDEVINLEEIKFTESEQKEIGIQVRSMTLYKIKAGNQLKAYMYLDKAPSKFDKFDYMVIFNTDFTIKLVKILVYREDQGAEIMSSSFLNQFRGKSSASSFTLGEDIQGISGATISCRSATNGIKKLTQKITRLEENKKL